MANLRSILKNTVDVNKRYSNALLDLSREYVKALDPNITELQHDSEAPDKLFENMQRAGSLLLAEEAGQVAKAAFPIHNSSNEIMEINLILSSDNLPYFTELTPASVTLQPGQSTVIRVKSHITEEGKSHVVYRGDIRVSELEDYRLSFMVVKLN